MYFHAKKFLSYTAIATVLNSSFYPLYANPNHFKDKNLEDSPEKKSLRLLSTASENSFYEQTKTPSTAQLWVPQFAQDFASNAYNKLTSLFSPTPNTVHEYEGEDFEDTIEELKSYKPNQMDLDHLQSKVWKGQVTAYQYSKGLKELEPVISKTRFKKTKNKFEETLKSQHAFLNWNFQRDLVEFLQSSNPTQARNEEFEDLLSYYRQFQNPLDYTETLVGFKRFIQQNKKNLNLTEQAYWALNKGISSAVKQRDETAYSALRKERQQFIRFSQELPYYEQEIPQDDVFNSSLPSESKSKKNGGEGFSLLGAAKGIGQGIRKGANYLYEHPGKAITLGLAGQMTAAAALNVPKTPDVNQGLLGDGFQDQNSQLSFSHSMKRQIGNELQIAQNTPFQYIGNAIVTQLMDGNAFAAWVAYNSSPTANYQIYGSIYSPNGVPIGQNFNITPLTGGALSTGAEPAIDLTGLENGNAFVTWNSASLSYALFSPTGTVIGSQNIIPQDSFYQGQSYPSVTSLTGGNIFMAWEAGGAIISGRFFASDGSFIGNPIEVSQGAPSNLNQGLPSVTSLTNGDAFVIWNSGGSSTLGRTVAPDGTLSSLFQLENNMGNYGTKSMVGLNNGNVFVTWQNDTGAPYNNYGRIYSSSGIAITNEFQLNQSPLYAASGYPSVTSLENGNVFTVWSNSSISNGNIFGRIFTSNGAALGNAFQIDQGVNVVQSYPFVSGLCNGNAFTVWNIGNSGSSLYIAAYGRVLTENGTPLTTPTPTVACSSNNGPTSGSGSASSGNKLMPSWLSSPMKIAADGVKSLWRMVKGAGQVSLYADGKFFDC